jgi:hypothetical protein
LESTVHKLSVGVTALALALVAAPAAAGELQLSFREGRVTLVARDVSVRQILDQWARVGQTRIVNIEKISGPVVSLQMVDVPETKALEALLRSASGYMVAARTGSPTGTSLFASVMILPVSSAPPVTAAGPVRPAPQPAMPQPVFQPAQPVESDEDDDDDDEADEEEPADQNQARPGFPRPSDNAPSVTAPAQGTERPGMVVPAPQPPQGGPRNPYGVQNPRGARPGTIPPGTVPPGTPPPGN